MRRAISFCCCVAIAAAACFYGVPDVVDSNDDDGGDDGSTLSGDAKANDGAPFDAGPGFCSTLTAHHTFCDDFDNEAGAQLSTLGTTTPPGQGMATIDGTDFLSYPRSLHMSANAGDQTNRVVQGFESLHGNMTIAFSVKFTGSPRNLAGLLIHDEAPSEEEIVAQINAAGEITVSDIGTRFDGGFYDGGSSGHAHSDPIAPNVWTQVKLDFFYLGATGDGGTSLSDSLTVNGQPVETATPDAFVGNGDGYFTFYGDPQTGSGCDVRFDNVYFDFQL